MTFEEIIRAAVRAEIETAVRPLRDALDRFTLPAPAADEDELGLADAKIASGYAVVTIRKAIAAGDLAAFKGNKEWRVRRGDLRAWTHKKRNSAPLTPLDISAKAAKMLAERR